MSKKRRNHSPEFKSKVALAAIKGDQTLPELSRQYGINGNLIVKWKKQLMGLSVNRINYSVASDRVLKQSELLAILFAFLHNL